ncbi:hypothetical protein, partial [Ensifer sp.]|uniref:hypothetical protein n=1 Tax=Ensifer sp. TaxID=1872086 RepID=UPI002E0F8985|nr:hypothetical protein [Ensifer sp.]
VVFQMNDLASICPHGQSRLRRSTGEFVVGACDGEKAKGRKAGYCHAIVMPATALPAEKTWRPLYFPLPLSD